MRLAAFFIYWLLLLPMGNKHVLAVSHANDNIASSQFTGSRVALHQIVSNSSLDDSNSSVPGVTKFFDYDEVDDEDANDVPAKKLRSHATTTLIPTAVLASTGSTCCIHSATNYRHQTYCRYLLHCSLRI